MSNIIDKVRSQKKQTVMKTREKLLNEIEKLTKFQKYCIRAMFCVSFCSTAHTAFKRIKKEDFQKKMKEHFKCSKIEGWEDTSIMDISPNIEAENIYVHIEHILKNIYILDIFKPYFEKEETELAGESAKYISLNNLYR